MYFQQEVKAMQENKRTFEMLQEYFKQSKMDERLSYDDEIRAEADLCSECCSCCRVCCIASS